MREIIHKQNKPKKAGLETSTSETMLKNTASAILFLFVCSFFFASCKKEELGLVEPKKNIDILTSKTWILQSRDTLSGETWYKVQPAWGPCTQEVVSFKKDSLESYFFQSCGPIMGSYGYSKIFWSINQKSLTLGQAEYKIISLDENHLVFQMIFFFNEKKWGYRCTYVPL